MGFRFPEQLLQPTTEPVLLKLKRDAEQGNRSQRETIDGIIDLVTGERDRFILIPERARAHVQRNVWSAVSNGVANAPIKRGCKTMWRWTEGRVLHQIGKMFLLNLVVEAQNPVDASPRHLGASRCTPATILAIG